MNDLEVWLKFRDTDYQVSSYGRVKRMHRKIKGNFTMLKPCINKDGYLRVDISKNGRAKHFQIHRLVGELFVENPHNKPVVNHQDTNKLNNHFKNLEWCTVKENAHHAAVNGLYPDKKGENASGSKLKSSQVIEIRQRYHTHNTELANKLAKEYGVSYSTIIDIFNRKSWNHL